MAGVARELVAGGCSLVVGCCAGADAAVLSPVPGRAVRVLCAFGPGGAAAGPASAVRAVLAAKASGVPVAWWSGGGPSVPLRARLARRTLAVVAETSALVLFPASPVVAGSGSWLAASAAVARGLPVVVFPVGFPAAALPEFGGGRWVPASGAGVWASAWRWAPGQLALPV